MPLRILLSLVPDRRADLDHARRHIAYDRLVLATGPEGRARAEAVARQENEALGRGHEAVASVLDLPSLDPMKALDVLTRATRRFGPATLVLNAAGGTPAQMVACMILAFHEGIETVFVQHGHVARLPVLQRAPLPEWFPEDEAALVRAAAHDAAIGVLRERLELSSARSDRLVRALVRKGLAEVEVRSGVSRLCLTATGLLVADHLDAAAHPPGADP